MRPIFHSPSGSNHETRQLVEPALRDSTQQTRQTIEMMRRGSVTDGTTGRTRPECKARQSPFLQDLEPGLDQAVPQVHFFCVS